MKREQKLKSKSDICLYNCRESSTVKNLEGKHRSREVWNYFEKKKTLVGKMLVSKWQLILCKLQ